MLRAVRASTRSRRAKIYSPFALLRVGEVCRYNRAELQRRMYACHTHIYTQIHVQTYIHRTVHIYSRGDILPRRFRFHSVLDLHYYHYYYHYSSIFFISGFLDSFSGALSCASILPSQNEEGSRRVARQSIRQLGYIENEKPSVGHGALHNPIPTSAPTPTALYYSSGNGLDAQTLQLAKSPICWRFFIYLFFTFLFHPPPLRWARYCYALDDISGRYADRVYGSCVPYVGASIDDMTSHEEPEESGTASA